MGGGGGLDTHSHMGRPIGGCCTIYMAASDGKRDSNASGFAPIFVLSDSVYGGGMARLRLQGGWGGGTQRNGEWHTYFRRN